MRHIILLISFCMLSGTLPAQQLLGVRGGYGQHRMYFNVTPQPLQQWESGGNAGLVFRTLNSSQLGLQLELLMEQKGWHLFPGTEDAYALQEQHLTLPVQSVVLLGKGRFQFMVGAGAFVSYIMSEKIITNGAGSRVYEAQPKQDWHYGLVGSLGPALHIGSTWLQLEGRFSNTFSNRLAPNLAIAGTYNLSWQQSASVSLVWLVRIGSSKNNK